jgi:hypothetical protein
MNTATKPAFSFTLTERNGEQEYSHDYLVYANTQKEADEMATEHARNWYDNTNELDPYDKDNDCFWFLGGCIAVTISPCSETDAEQFAIALADRYTLGSPEPTAQEGTVVEIAPSRVRKSKYGCVNCLWNSCECDGTSATRYKPADDTKLPDNEEASYPTCGNYVYND